MKSRTGYVSNSSSSSFVVMYKEGAAIRLVGAGSQDAGADCMTLTAEDLFKMFDQYSNYSYESSAVLAEGVDSVLSQVAERDSCGYCRYGADEAEAEAIAARIEAARKEYPCAGIIRLAYDDEALGKIFRAFVKSGEMVVMHEAEG